MALAITVPTQVVEGSTIIINATGGDICPYSVLANVVINTTAPVTATILVWDRISATAGRIVALVPKAIDPQVNVTVTITAGDGVGTANSSATLDVISMPTDEWAGTKADLVVNRPGRVEIDGFVVGYLDGNIEIDPSREFIDIQPAQCRSVIKKIEIKTECKVNFNLNEYNLNMIKLALGLVTDYAYTSTPVSSPVEFKSLGEAYSHSLVIFDQSGFLYCFPNIQIDDPAALTINPGAVQVLPVSATAYPATEGDADSLVFSVYEL